MQDKIITYRQIGSKSSETVATENLNVSDHMGDSGIHGRIILLKRILRKQVMRASTGLNRLRIGAS